MSQPSLKQWDEDRKRLRVVYDHSNAKPVEKKNKIKKNRPAAFMSALLAERTKSSEQLQYTMTNTSDSSLGKEQCGAQAKRDEVSSHGRKETQSNMIQIFINTPMNPKCLCLRLNHNTTICKLKQIIHSKLGIRPSLQTLHTSKQGFKLCDALTLLDLGIEPETNIDLTLTTEGLLGGAPTLDETFLRTLAGKLGTDWQQLATNLRFTSTEIGNFECLAEDNQEEQAFQMLVSWRTKQHDDGGAEEWLRSALVQTGRRDLAARIPGYERPTGKKYEVHSRQASEHEKMLRVLAENIGRDWKQLATSLGFKAAQIETFESDYTGDLKEQAFQMFLAWSRKQSNQAEVEDGLKEAHVKLGRADMVQIISDVPVNIETCSKTLVSHYKETMKVNTHPTCKDMAVDMDQLYVGLELLQETNQPNQPITLQSHKQDQTMHTDIKDEPEVDKTKTEYKKISLKSYEDMLSLDKERILISAESGYGKSTLLKKIAYDWAVLQSGTHLTHQQKSPLSKYKLVFLLEINKMGVNFNIMDEIISQILSQNEFKKKDLENYITRHPDKVLILLDGADEISFQTLQKATEDFSVNNVLSFKSLKRCKAIVTSRQSTALKLLTCNPDFTRINIVGFDDKNKQEYIRKYFNNYDSQRRAEVLSEINKSETLRSLGKIPLFLWLMCSLLGEGKIQLPDRITKMLDLATSIIYKQKMSKDCTSKPSEKITKEGFNELMAKLGKVALEGLKSDGKHSFAVSDFDSEDLVNLGCEVGLLTRVQFMHGIERVEQVQFYHMIIMQFCCSVYLADLAESSLVNFKECLSGLLKGDVDRIGYLIRFCSGRNKEAANYVVKLTKQHLSVYNKNTPVDCERYVCLHKIMMLALFESQLDSTVKTLVFDEWVRFPYELKGEELLAAHYFIQNLPPRSNLHLVSDNITITCQGETDLNLVEQIMARTVCDLSLEVVGVDMNDKIHKLQDTSKFLTSLTLTDCQLSRVSLPQLFNLIKSASKLKTLHLSWNNLHGLKSDQIPRIPSLEFLTLERCKLQSDDVGPLFSIVAAAGSVTKLVLLENNLHGIQGDQITPVSSLKELHLHACNLQSDEIGPLFSIVAAAGSVTQLVLKENDLHGIKGDQITPVSSLKELHLYACNLQSDDIGPLFSIMAAAGSVTKLSLVKNDLHGIKGDQITPVSSLKELHLYTCSLESDDIGPLFSIVAAAGSVTALVLWENDLHGIKGGLITPVSSLKELHLHACNLQSDDIVPLFSIVAAAGSVTTLSLVKNDIHGIKGDQITPVSSLKELHLGDCNLQSDDIGPLFFIVAAAGSVTALFLKENDLHGIKGGQITPVSSLKELYIYTCSLQRDDIGPLFSIMAAVGSLTKVCLKESDLHGIQGDQLSPVSSLKELHLHAFNLQSDDIGPLFSIVAAAGSVTKLVLEENDLHGIKGDQITPVSSLKELHLHACNLQSDDIGPLFSIMAAAGSVTTLSLVKNDLHGIKGDQITPVSSLKELQLYTCSLESDDIGPLFSIVAAAGSVTTLVLWENDLHGIKGDPITRVSSLKELYLDGCSLQRNDIGPLFSIVAAAGSLEKVALIQNNLHGIQVDQVVPVPSLGELSLLDCGLQDDDFTALSLALNMHHFGPVLYSQQVVQQLAQQLQHGFLL